MAKQPLTVEQQLMLSHAAWSWAEAVALLRSPRDASGDVVTASGFVTLVAVEAIENERYRRGIHMLALGLDHIDSSLKLLSERWPDGFPSALSIRFQTDEI